MIDIAAQLCGGLCLIQKPQCVITPFAGGLGIGAVFGGKTRAMPGMDQAAAQVAVDTVRVDQAEQAGLGVLGHVPKLPRAICACHLRESMWIEPLAGMDLAAVAPGGAIADAAGFEHGDIDAHRRQFQRRAEPRIAAADDRHIDVHIAGRRARRLARDAVLIPGAVWPRPVRTHTLSSRNSRSHGLIVCMKVSYSCSLTRE